MFRNFKLQYLIPTIGIILFFVIITIVFKSQENFEDDIDPMKKEYDDALEKRIAEAKNTTRFDAELLLDINRPYKSDKDDRQGWWANVVDGLTNPDIYHKKKSSDWIWPF